MDKTDKLKKAIEVLEHLVSIEFTGKVELNFTNGSIRNIIKTEKLDFCEVK